MGGILPRFALAPDAVERHVGADVEIVAEARQAGIAGLGNSEQRAGFGIALAEAQEVVGQGGGQDHQVALDEMRGGAARMSGPPAFTDGQARRYPGRCR